MWGMSSAPVQVRTPAGQQGAPSLNCSGHLGAAWARKRHFWCQLLVPRVCQGSRELHVAPQGMRLILSLVRALVCVWLSAPCPALLSPAWGCFLNAEVAGWDRVVAKVRPGVIAPSGFIRSAAGLQVNESFLCAPTQLCSVALTSRSTAGILVTCLLNLLIVVVLEPREFLLIGCLRWAFAQYWLLNICLSTVWSFEIFVRYHNFFFSFFRSSLHRAPRRAGPCCPL